MACLIICLGLLLIGLVSHVLLQNDINSCSQSERLLLMATWGMCAFYALYLVIIGIILIPASVLGSDTLNSHLKESSDL